MKKTVIKTFKYRLYPNKAQQEMLNKHFGCCRFLYNYFLNERKNFYLDHKEDEKKSLNYYDNARTLTVLKTKQEYNWLNETNSQSLQQSLRHLDIAYNKFFRKESQFPRFKSKHSKQSFTIPQNFYVKDDKLHIPKLKTGIDIVLHRPITGRLLHATISKNKVNQYFISITSETEHEILKRNENIIGLDLGIKDLVITSEGKKYENIKVYQTREKKIKFNQRQTSKKKKGSNSRNKQQFKLARVHNKVANIRANHLHQISHEIIHENQVIISEDLAVANMLKNHCLAKSISNCSWGELIRQFSYKSGWNDREYIKINRFFPSSKTCNICGFILEELNLNIREWTCPKCNTVHDRDKNAAINIKNQGLNIKNCGLGTKSQYKQKSVEASAVVESMKPDAHILLGLSSSHQLH